VLEDWRQGVRQSSQDGVKFGEEKIPHRKRLKASSCNVEWKMV
jgi:hypothetical protein